MIVLRRGMLKGLKGMIPDGGHDCPNSISGERDEWKYIQKNEIKKNTSEMIKRIIPIRILLRTYSEWDPENVASRVTSFHHKYMHINVGGIVMRGLDPILCIHNVDEAILLKILSEIKRGQGLAVTIWKGW